MPKSLRIIFLRQEDINRPDRIAGTFPELNQEHFPAYEFVDLRPASSRSSPLAYSDHTYAFSSISRAPRQRPGSLLLTLPQGPLPDGSVREPYCVWRLQQERYVSGYFDIADQLLYSPTQVLLEKSPCENLAP